MIKNKNILIAGGAGFIGTNLVKRLLVGNKITYQDLPENDSKKRKPDITLAKQRLKWSPKVKLEQGLKKTIRWFN